MQPNTCYEIPDLRVYNKMHFKAEFCSCWVTTAEKKTQKNRDYSKN